MHDPAWMRNRPFVSSVRVPTRPLYGDTRYGGKTLRSRRNRCGNLWFGRRTLLLIAPDAKIFLPSRFQNGRLLATGVATEPSHFGMCNLELNNVVSLLHGTFSM